VRYLVIVMMVPLLLGGCLGSFAEDFGKGVGGAVGADIVRGWGQDVPYLGERWRRDKREGAYWSDFSAGSKSLGRVSIRIMFTLVLRNGRSCQMKIFASATHRLLIRLLRANSRGGSSIALS
jgi:hypothetical protein